MAAAALLMAPASSLLPTRATAAEPIPAQAFYRPADIERALLSPSGRWLALATAQGGSRIGLAVFDLKEWKLHAVAARFTDADIHHFEWVNDERLVFDLIDRTRGGGEQRWWPGLFSVARDGKELTQLVKLNRPLVVRDRSIGREPLDPWHVLLHVPRAKEGTADEVIVGEYEFDGSGEVRAIRAKRLNVTSQRTRNLSLGLPDNVVRWFFDPEGEPRLVATRKQGRSALHWRAPGQEGWRQIAEFDALRAPYAPRFVDSEGGLYVSALEGRDSVAVLKRFDFATGRPAAEALVSTPGFDFNGELVTEVAGERALGVHVLTDAESTVWFDARLAALQKEADGRFPGRINRLSCRQCGSAERVTLIRSWSDQDPGQFWLHSAATGEWRRVGARRTEIDPQRMGMTDFVRIKARDGLEIPLWITKPAGAGKAPLPAVLLVHGGPWVRGRSWEWNADAQFLASRGYVVIEPEFRGSTGYGDRLYRAGWKQWGQAMQDDLADALAWAVAQGHVDGRRVCIAGASYGGYATLMGLVRHADQFRCGVAWLGVTDPRLMFQWRYDSDVRTESREHAYPALIGDPVADAAMLDANTPVLLAERIKAPLLLAYGGDDRRVPLVHGTRMRDALAAAGRAPEWVVYPGEGHGWLKLETRLDFARRLEEFLARHLGP